VPAQAWLHAASGADGRIRAVGSRAMSGMDRSDVELLLRRVLDVSVPLHGAIARLKRREASKICCTFVIG
jgi:hypothetical protein